MSRLDHSLLCCPPSKTSKSCLIHTVYRCCCRRAFAALSLSHPDPDDAHLQQKGRSCVANCDHVPAPPSSHVTKVWMENQSPSQTNPLANVSLLALLVRLNPTLGETHAVIASQAAFSPFVTKAPQASCLPSCPQNSRLSPATL